MIEYRRRADTPWGKIVSAWPLIVALVSVIVMGTTIKNEVDEHETRLQKLEHSVDVVRSNTDRLVAELLDRHGRR